MFNRWGNYKWGHFFEAVLPADVCNEIKIPTKIGDNEISNEDTFDPEVTSTLSLTEIFYKFLSIELERLLENLTLNALQKE